MPFILHTLYVIALMPIAVAWVAARHRVIQFGRFDNRYPRQQQSQLTGMGARAMNAQANCWEALAMYTATVVIATASGIPLDTLTTPALLFVCCRVAFVMLYLFDKPTARSLAFTAAVGCCAAIVTMSARHAA